MNRFVKALIEPERPKPCKNTVYAYTIHSDRGRTEARTYASDKGIR